VPEPEPHVHSFTRAVFRRQSDGYPGPVERLACACGWYKDREGRVCRPYNVHVFVVPMVDPTGKEDASASIQEAVDLSDLLRNAFPGLPVEVRAQVAEESSG
jgi:hypothetical protein